MRDNVEGRAVIILDRVLMIVEKMMIIFFGAISLFPLYMSVVAVLLEYNHRESLDFTVMTAILVTY